MDESQGCLIHKLPPIDIEAGREWVIDCDLMLELLKTKRYKALRERIENLRRRILSALGLSKMAKANCALCGYLVYASPKPETWGIEWIGNRHVHYKCANDLFEAVRRIQNADKLDMGGEISPAMRVKPDDEIVKEDTHFHMERMDGDHIWFSLGDDVAFDLYVEKRKLLWKPQYKSWEALAKSEQENDTE